MPIEIAETLANESPAYAITAWISRPIDAPETPVRRALNIFADNDLVAPADDHLELIVRFALEAQQFFFSVATYEPDEVRLVDFFTQFILFCASPAPMPGA